MSGVLTCGPLNLFQSPVRPSGMKEFSTSNLDPPLPQAKHFVQYITEMQFACYIYLYCDMIHFYDIGMDYLLCRGYSKWESGQMAGPEMYLSS